MGFKGGLCDGISPSTTNESFTNFENFFYSFYEVSPNAFIALCCSAAFLSANSLPNYISCVRNPSFGLIKGLLLLTYLIAA